MSRSRVSFTFTFTSFCTCMLRQAAWSTKRNIGIMHLAAYNSTFSRMLVHMYQTTRRYVQDHNLSLFWKMYPGLVAGFSPRRPRSCPGLVHAGFMVDKVQLEQVSLSVFRFSQASTIPKIFHINQSLTLYNFSNSYRHYVTQKGCTQQVPPKNWYLTTRYTMSLRRVT
jgi:hypothetical protein